MPRKGATPKREVLPDPKYGSRVVTKFVNQMMYDGKKSVAEKIFYDAIEELGKRTDSEPLRAFEQLIEKVKPQMEVKSRRVGGATYQVPMEVNSRRSTALGIRWIVNFSRARKEKTMAERLANEILDASNGLGASVKKREDVFKMAEANRAFSHYRW